MPPKLFTIQPTNDRAVTPNGEGANDPLRGEGRVSTDDDGRYLLGADGKIYCALGSGGKIRGTVFQPSGAPAQSEAATNGGARKVILTSAEYGIVLIVTETGGANSITPCLLNADAAPAVGNKLWQGSSIAASGSTSNPQGLGQPIKGPLYLSATAGLGQAQVWTQKYAQVSMA